MDFSKLTNNNMIAAGGGVGALLSAFMPWFGFGGFNVNGGGLMWLGILCILGGVTVLLLKVLDQQNIELQGLSAEQIAMVLTGLGLLFFLLKLLIGESLVSRQWGAFFGVIAAGAALAGSFLSAKDEGIGLPSADDFKGEGSGGGETTTF